jgi:hypothetical protein
MQKKIFLLLFLFLGTAALVQAQKIKKKWLHDSTYYDMYPHKLTGRIYVSKKFEDIKVPSGGSATDLKFVANRKLNFGVGATWHNLTLNLSYGFSNYSADRGKTKGLDFQLRFFPHKWVIDLLAIMPKGMYIKPKGTGTNNGTYYTNEDTKERIYGFAAYRVPNKEKFSYRAALVQNEWQKKSAGSLLYGGEALYVIGPENDSLFIPALIADNYAGKGIKEMRYISVGPGIGYAYTAVMDRHFFIMGSLIANLKVNIATEEHLSGDFKKTAIAPSGIYKAAIGYNSDTWSLVASASGNILMDKGPKTNQNYFYKSGQIRVALAKKFDLKKKNKK